MEKIENGIEVTGTLYTSAKGDAKDKLAYAEQIYDQNFDNNEIIGLDQSAINSYLNNEIININSDLPVIKNNIKTIEDDINIVSTNLENTNREVKRIINSFNTSVIDTNTIYYTINQTGDISDSGDMVSPNYVVDINKTFNEIPGGLNGDPNINFLCWLKENTNAFVAKKVLDSTVIGNFKLKLRQLSHNNRTMYADGTSAYNDIHSIDGNTDVFIKFPCDVYYKTEPYHAIISGESSLNDTTNINPDYILVTITKNKPDDFDNENSPWQKWDQYHLIGVYQACVIDGINSKLHSISGIKAKNNISQINAINYAKNKGKGYNICNYDMTRFIAFLFYGYYNNLNCQYICGYGTNNLLENIYYPKVNGLTDELGMIDTTRITGNRNNSLSNEIIIAGKGEDIKSVNFWGIENCWGDIYEWISDIKIMVGGPATSSNTIAFYIKHIESIKIYNENSSYDDGNGYRLYYDVENFLIDYPDDNAKFIVILDDNNKIIRAIYTGFHENSYNCVKKMIFGKKADIIAKEFQTNTSLYFCDYQYFGSAGGVGCRSCFSSYSDGGVGCLNAWYGPGAVGSHIGARLLFKGNKDNIRIINN